MTCQDSDIFIYYCKHKWTKRIKKKMKWKKSFIWNYEVIIWASCKCVKGNLSCWKTLELLFEESKYRVFNDIKWGRKK